MPTFTTETPLIAHLRNSGVVLCTSSRGGTLIGSTVGTKNALRLSPAVHAGHPSASGNATNGVDWSSADTDVIITRKLHVQLMNNPASLFWRHTTRTFDRSFVFLDISAFSEMKAGVQLIVVTHIIDMARTAGTEGMPEAQLCIGDGYIYAFEDVVRATAFAGHVAQLIEWQVATWLAPDFHFRIGVHAGPVRFFWDPGRGDYNYIGEGINDASRVLGAIGKDIDDVIFVSAIVRQMLRRPDPRRSGADKVTANQILSLLDNKGTRKDKHGNPHRVYQFNHSGLSPLLRPHARP